jgi:hypothetical protein
LSGGFNPDEQTFIKSENTDVIVKLPFIKKCQGKAISTI